MIHPQQAAVMMPYVHGILAGYQSDFEGTEKQEPCRVSCRDYYSGSKQSAPSPFADKSVYVTYLSGTMTRHDSCESYGTKIIASELLKADRDPEIIGHIIVADSGGGAVDSVPDLADAIKQLSKPVVAFVDGMAASACIYAISYTNKIIAHQPTDMVGCVGTMITVSGWPKVRRDANGYVQVRIYADQSEEKNADYEAALEGNTQIIKEELLNPLCEQFISDMKANRPNCTDDQLKGRTYFARDVIGSLIDSIGSFDDAVHAVMDLAEERNQSSTSQMARYNRLESIPELSEQVYAEDGSTVLQECQLEAIEQALTSPRAEEADLQSRLDTLTAQHQTEIDNLNSTISARDARITELEAALAASEARNSQEQPATVEVNADPASGEGETEGARTYEEAVAVCKEFINRKN